jgi:gluconolactonase
MRRAYRIAAALLLSFSVSPGLAQVPGGIPGVVAPGTKPQLVSDRFKNTEAPIGAPDGSVYFSDTAANRTYRIDPSGSLGIAREGTKRGDGLGFTPDGKMIWAEGALPGLTERDPELGFRNLVAGVPLLGPNDLVVDSRGGIYFSDHNPRPVIPGLKVYVYYLAPGATRPRVVDDTIGRTNGVALSPDEKTLYADDTLGNTIYAYERAPDGTTSHKRAFARLRGIPPGKESVADGMAIDREGRLYVAALTGIQVFDAAGIYLGTITLPNQPSNLAFGGPEKRSLYISARHAIYRLKMLAQGPDRPGK